MTTGVDDGTGDAATQLALQPTVEASPSPSPDATRTSPHVDPRGGPAPGLRIGRYEVGALIGAGGMGVVYRAQDPELKRPLAIKLVRNAGGSSGQARVLREAQAMARLRHPNVVPVFDVGTHDGEVYLVLPLLEGGTLGTWMRAEPRPWRAVVQRFLGAARGLAAAHAAGLVHRDFKPDNVLLGAGDEVQVADFGLVRLDEDPPTGGAAEPVAAPGTSVTRTGAVMGTPAYMAPEQIDGAAVGPAADQFAFCVALHEALYGQRPFAAPSGEPSDLTSLRDAIRAARVRAAPSDRDVPRWLRAAILRGLRDAPAARWPSMPSLIAALDRGLHRPRRLALAALAAAVATAVALWATVDRTSLTPTAPTTRPVIPWTERKLSTRGDIREAAVAPTGDSIATLGRDVLSVAPIDGRPARVLLRDLPETAGHLSWSPDGTTLMVGMGLDHDRSWVYRRIDVASGRVIDPPILSNQAVTLVDSDHFVFAMDFVRDRLILRRIDSDRAVRVVEIPEEEERWVEHLDVVGARLYVTTVFTDYSWALMATDHALTPLTTVVPRSSARGTVGVAIAANGQVYASSIDERGVLDLVEYGVDGRPSGARHRLAADTTQIVGMTADRRVATIRTSSPWRLIDPTEAGTNVLASSTVTTLAMAPDGRRLAMVENVPGEPARLYVTDLRRLDPLPPPVTTGAVGAAWSPDGSKLAVCRTLDRRTLAVMDADGGGMRELDADDLSSTCDLAWLDDHRVSYQRMDNRTFNWIDLRDGTRGELLAPTLGWPFSLAVSTRGDAIVFWNRVGERGTWIIPRSGAPYRVTELPSGPTWSVSRYRWSADGATVWVGHDRDLFQYDLARHLLTRTSLPWLAPDTRIVDVLPLADRTLVQVESTIGDVYLYGPEPPAVVSR